MNFHSILDHGLKVVAASILVGVWNIYTSVNELVPAIKNQQEQINKLNLEVSGIKGSMVTWDTLKRIELTLSDLSSRGKGNEAMRAVATTIKVEREGRKD
jgi:hypothetical protein